MENSVSYRSIQAEKLEWISGGIILITIILEVSYVTRALKGFYLGFQLRLVSSPPQFFSNRVFPKTILHHNLRETTLQLG